MSPKVFVYGTLKRNQGNHHLLIGAIPLGEYITEPKYNMYSLGGFPGVTGSGITAITGELYEVTPDILKKLDGLEGYRVDRDGISCGLYDRIEIDTTEGKALMYTIRPDYVNNQRLIKDGIW